jgi:alpha-beta hydrolase superfamily lysophospholipase
MILKEEFYYDSRDKETKIHAIKWIPDEKPNAILQISHGMVEYIDRYDDFARFLAERGILVVGNDHLGHGNSIKSKQDYGYFCEKDGNTVVVRDMHRLKKITQEENPGVPFFLLGHSMGSFLTRQYLTIYGKGVDGAIIVGTGEQPDSVLNFGMVFIKIIKTFKGWRYRSNFVKNISFKGYNSHFEPKRSEIDWLTRDEKIVDFYAKEERCQFIFSLNAYYNMFLGIKYLNRDNNLKMMPHSLPILFVSGKEDPVGGYGKLVEKVYEKFREIGMEDVAIKLYEDDRHEILNELDKEIIYDDIYEWMKEKLVKING